MPLIWILPILEAERLNGEIEAVQEEIRCHNETRDAWETVARNAGNTSRFYQSVTYVKGEDVQWHMQRLDMEIEALQGEIRLHNETKDAWEMIVHDTGSESQAAYLEVVNSETARLNREIEAVQDKIRRHLGYQGCLGYDPLQHGQRIAHLPWRNVYKGLGWPMVPAEGSGQ